jgi:hypothetical protein
MNELDEIYIKIKEKYYDNNTILKRKIPRKNFIRFLLSEIKKISEWNNKSKLLKFTSFNLKFKLDQDFKKKLDELFLNNVLSITKYLDKIIQNGWQWGVLSIFEYNLIVYFADFCNKMSVIEKSKSINHKDFMKMENAFLKITSKENMPDQIVAGLEKILIFYNKLSFKSVDNIKEELKKLKYFFIPNYYYPSFYDLILSYNMVHYKQYLDWSDLFKTGPDYAVQNKFYECSQDTFNGIIRYIKDLKKDIDALEKDKVRIEWFKNLSEIKSLDYPDLIVKFYENNRHDWKKDKEDFFLFIILLIEDLIKKLDEMLHKEYQVMDNREKIINIRLLQDNELEVIYNKLKTDFELSKVKHLNLIPLKIPIREYIRKEYPDSLFKENDHKYLYLKIMKMFSYLREMAHILRKYYDPINENIEKDEKNKFMIVSPQEWRGEPVFAVYKFYILLFLQICGYFRENDLLSDIRKLQDIEKKLKSKKEKYNNIMGSDDFIKEMIE